MSWIMVPAFLGVAVLLFVKVYCKLTLGKCNSKRKLDGKTVLVTGSNTGIGYYTALDLAKRGARVIITSKDFKDLKRAQKQMIQESGNTEIVAKYLDFLSLDEVRAFVKDILATESRLDILINNAGSSKEEQKYTKDGLLSVLQINYFGPFLLTNLLLDLLKQSSPSRIVNVGSMGANVGFGFDSTNINSTKKLLNFDFSTAFTYINSKICQTSSTIEMAKRLKGTGITVNCLHTGVVHTRLHYQARFSSLLASVGQYIHYKTPAEGAETSIHVAVCEKVEGVTGKYFRDCRPSRLWVNLGPETRNRVWEQSIRLVGLKPEEMLL